MNIHIYIKITHVRNRLLLHLFHFIHQYEGKPTEAQRFSIKFHSPMKEKLTYRRFVLGKIIQTSENKS